MINTNTLPHILRRTREQAGVSQQWLADALNVSQATISRWEAGEREVGLDDLGRIAAALDTNVVAMLEEMNQQKNGERQ